MSLLCLTHVYLNPFRAATSFLVSIPNHFELDYASHQSEVVFWDVADMWIAVFLSRSSDSSWDIDCSSMTCSSNLSRGSWSTSFCWRWQMGHCFATDQHTSNPSTCTEQLSEHTQLWHGGLCKYRVPKTSRHTLRILSVRLLSTNRWRGKLQNGTPSLTDDSNNNM